MRRCVLLLVLGVSFLAPAAASACLRPPKELTVHHTELVKRAEWIALARAEKSESIQEDKDLYIRTTFTTLEAVKGTPKITFSKTIWDEYAFRRKTPKEAYKDVPHADFHGHSDWRFWEDRASRQWNGADCGMHPEFEVGATYLVFYDGVGHWKGFERIDRPDDRWLAAVRALVGDPTKPSGYVLSLADYMRSHVGVLIGRAEQCNQDVTYKHPDYPGYELGTYAFSFEPKHAAPTSSSKRVRFHAKFTHACEVGRWYVVLLRKETITTRDHEVLPNGRLLPLFTKSNQPATTYSDGLRIDINALDSEALISDDAHASVARIRELLAAQPCP